METHWVTTGIKQNKLAIIDMPESKSQPQILREKREFGLYWSVIKISWAAKKEEVKIFSICFNQAKLKGYVRTDLEI